MKTIQIANRLVGDGQPVFIVVETGTTCNGDIATALRMIDAAKAAGADAIKFQMIDPDYFMSDTTVEYEYEWAGGVRRENMYKMFKGLTFTADEWRRLGDRCRQVGILFYATIDFVPGVDLAESLGMDALKLSSWDAANFPLAGRMAKTGKSLQVDLGPTWLADIEALLDVCRREGNENVVLVHCSHATDDGGINVRTVPYLKQVFHLPVGYSADSRDFVPDLVAVGLGANLIEKRMTLDRNYEGHHHIKALEPDEFAEWVTMIRRAEAVRGEFALRPSAEDLRQRQLYFVSIVAERDIPAGTTITHEMLACKRPGSGLSPAMLEQVVGQRASRDIKRNEQIDISAL